MAGLDGLAGMTGLDGLAGLTARMTARLTAKLMSRGKELHVAIYFLQEKGRLSNIYIYIHI